MMLHMMSILMRQTKFDFELFYVRQTAAKGNIILARPILL
jgi:hypothetical protein